MVLLSVYSDQETSLQDGSPIELYLFNYNEANYTYTSHFYAINQKVDGQQFTFAPEYIKRSDSLKLGDSSGTMETCTINVLRTNNVALLFQGPPPENGSVRVQIFRQHGDDASNAALIRILRGVVSQVRFTDSEAELTITIEHILKREIPRGKLSYYCQNLIYDFKCQLSEDAYKMRCRVDGGTDNLQKLFIKSDDLRNKPSGYYTDGFMKMGNCYRQIKQHTADTIYIKYPILRSERQGTFYVWPGCENLFSVCHEKFSNTDHFSGVPYQQPYDK